MVEHQESWPFQVEQPYHRTKHFSLEQYHGMEGLGAMKLKEQRQQMSLSVSSIFHEHEIGRYFVRLAGQFVLGEPHKSFWVLDLGDVKT